ncbi:hypothetical protein [Streptomyces sp. NPDC048252]|uniref:hypothetical protein n=1 Tax=Streptomyces sp. NPDC048252 TaxID=3154612 RepID=UPI00343CF3D7
MALSSSTKFHTPEDVRLLVHIASVIPASSCEQNRSRSPRWRTGRGGEGRAELLVLGSRGLGGIGGFLVGSAAHIGHVTYAVRHHSTAVVAVVPHGLPTRRSPPITLAQSR